MVAVEAASPPAETGQDGSDAARTIQFDVQGLLNARAVTVLSSQKLVAWNKGIDGTWSGLATRAAADAMGSEGRVALPDDGVFPANPVHPRVQLRFSNADPTGNQVRYTDRNTPDSYSLAVAEDFYSNLSLFFMSAFGASEISVEIAYSDRTAEVKAYSVEDWAVKFRETETKYFLSANLAKWGPKNTELEKDSHYLMGLNLQPAPTKKVAKVTVHKPASGTSLVFWGATGYKARPEPRLLPGNAAEISYEGRTVVTPEGTERLGYPGIGVRVHFRGTELNLHARTASSELYLDVAVDGNPPQFVQVPKGDSDIALAKNLAAGEHQVVIWKRVESAVGVLEVMSFATIGEFLPPPRLPERRLMFLGDSFAAGQATTVEDGGPMDPSKAKRQNARLSFGRLLADRLHAQCHIIAYAGRGVMRDWQGIRAVRCAPEYYEYALPDDPATRWDPKKYVPDAIGVCLGNNDFSEGVPDQTEYVRLYADFVRKLRRDAPEASIFLIPSPTLADEPGRVPLRRVLRAYLEEVTRRLGDPGVQVVPISQYPVVPGDGHPSGTAHRAIADELEPAFRKALKLDPLNNILVEEKPYKDPGLKNVAQVAIVVRDIATSTKLWAEVLGVSAPRIRTTRPGQEVKEVYRGQPTDGQVKLAFFDLGQVAIELLEPINEGTSWKEYLDKRGTGVQHLGFNVVDPEKTSRALEKLGYPVVHRGRFDSDDGVYIYHDGLDRLGVLVELLHRDKQP